MSAATVRRQALEWQVTLWSGEASEAEQAAFQRWLAADAEHPRAWQQVQRIERQIHALPAPVAAQVLRAPKPPPARRAVLRTLGGLAVASGVAAYGVRQTPQWQSAMAAHRTARGERRELVLPDGTRVVLNTASAIDLHFDAAQRRVLLRAGEILVTTAHDDAAAASRPFVVQTAQGSVRALGTRFSVRQADDASAVAVFEGAVELRPADDPNALRRLDAGQQARFDRVAVTTPEPTDAVAAAWTRGLLMAERMRLADFLAELGRYRSGVLRCDPAVAGQIVSGVYPLQDTDRVLAALAQALPIRVRYATRYWVSVGPRD